MPLVNLPERKIDPLGALLGAVTGNGANREVEPGIWLGGLNDSLHFRHAIVDEWPQIGDSYEHACYGVVDDPSQVRERLPLDDDPRSLIVLCHEVRRDDQPREGGWRWHKWGPYIGDHEPTTEYLHDEPEIERVFVYRVHEVRGGDDA